MSTRRRFRWRRLTNPALLLAAALAAAAILWVLAPLATPVDPVEARRYAQPTLAEELRYRALTALMGAWFFFFGASVGSFLNVVAWRLPRGETLIWRPSRCPRCGARIRAADNLPVFGWLKLRGRCRVCRTPISSRYPLVELFTGAAFLGLAALELFLGGVNLPLHRPMRYAGVAWIVFDPPWELIALYAYHCFLVSVLVSWALIDHDRRRIPTGYVLFAMLLAVVAPVAAAVIARLAIGEAIAYSLPRILHPVPAIAPPPDWLVRVGWWRLLLEPLAGVVAGLAMGAVLRLTASGAGRRPRVAAAMGLVGVFLGWQATVSTALVAALLFLLTSRRPNLHESWYVGAVLAAVLIHLACWRWLNAAPLWPAAESGPPATLGWGLLVLAIAWIAGRIAESRRAYAPVA